MPKIDKPSGTKVKRLTLYPKPSKSDLEKQAEENSAKLQAEEEAKQKAAKARTEEMAKENAAKAQVEERAKGQAAKTSSSGQHQPKYEKPVEPAPEQTEAESETEAEKNVAAKNAQIQATNSGWGLALLIAATIIGGILVIQAIDKGGGDCGKLSCGVIAPQCKCPAECPRYFIITSQQYRGYKQCQR